MSDQHASAVYHLAQPGKIPPGRLVHVEDQPGAMADIYLHPLNVRASLVWELNWITRQQVGSGLWQQRWTEGSRMQADPEGLGVADSRWEIVPAAAMPDDRAVFPVESEGSCIWLIREGQCTRAMRDAMNQLLERIAGDGLWLQAWYEQPGRRPGSGPAPYLCPPAAELAL